MTRRRGSFPECDFRHWDTEEVCGKSGDHFCGNRAAQVEGFIENFLVHTKGRWARKPFELRDWQRDDIVRPLFGTVVWSDEWEDYVRRYRVATICLARKNGKTELAAALVLYLLAGDGEEGAEVYGAAKDTKQAGKVFEPAWRMAQLSKDLSPLLKLHKHSRRIVYEDRAAYYEIITSDALGELGHNPHGFVLDEALSQQDDSLWMTMRTAAGARHQPLMLMITTETNEPHGFGAHMIDEAIRVQEDPDRAPHHFTYIRKTPDDADPWDESNWYHANPALGEFLSVDALRQEALEARNDPTKENAFRQFRLNQRVSQTTRVIPLDLWDANRSEIAPNPEWITPKLEGKQCWAGLDLSSKLDLTAWCLRFDDGQLWWRFWLPESQVTELDRHTGGKMSVWVDDGWVTATDGDVIDYQKIYQAVEEDNDRFVISSVTYDKWSGEPVRQEIESRTGLLMVESATTYTKMTAAVNEAMRGLKAKEFDHFGNPVARWMADNLEVKRPRDDASRVRPVKPDRTYGARIDGMVTWFMAEDGFQTGVTPERDRAVWTI